jgi:exodeoxyribonuclease VII large subunit
VDTERRHLVALRSRPVMANPAAMLDARRQELDALRDRAHRRVLATVHRDSDQVAHLRAQVRTLSPLSTLERGYAVVQHRDGRVVVDQAEVEVEELLRVRVANGDFAVRVAGLP